jgi:hypothetical protein
MSSLTVSPAVMINRIIHREGDSATPHLAKVAKLRMDLMVEADKQAARQTLFDPSGEVKQLPITNGAEVDRLV